MAEGSFSGFATVSSFDFGLLSFFETFGFTSNLAFFLALLVLAFELSGVLLPELVSLSAEPVEIFLLPSSLEIGLVSTIKTSASVFGFFLALPVLALELSGVLVPALVSSSTESVEIFLFLESSLVVLAFSKDSCRLILYSSALIFLNGSLICFIFLFFSAEPERSLFSLVRSTKSGVFAEAIVTVWECDCPANFKKLNRCQAESGINPADRWEVMFEEEEGQTD